MISNKKKINDENTKFINNQQIELKKQLKHQDCNLDELEKCIDRLGQTTKKINDEIKLQ